MKYEWRKKDKSLYLPKPTPTIIEIPKMQFLTIKGKGNPNSESFSKCVTALYALSYAIRMSPKKGIELPGYFEYTVFPLEGVWDLDDEGRKSFAEGIPITELKHYLTYEVMIRQPDFVTKEIIESLREDVYKKKKLQEINQVVLKVIDEGQSCQMCHIGSYDDEPTSFKQMEEYVLQEGYIRSSKTHREIYITDPSKVTTEKLKTTIRFKIKKH